MGEEKTRLLKAWALLMMLTAISVLAAYAGGLEGGKNLSLAVLMGTAFIKTRQVLDHFLELRTAKAGWRSFFTFLMAGLLLLILGLGLLPALMQEAS